MTESTDDRVANVPEVPSPEQFEAMSIAERQAFNATWCCGVTHPHRCLHCPHRKSAC